MEEEEKVLKDYELMERLNAIYNRVKYGNMKLEEMKALYQELDKYTDGSFGEE